MSRSNAGLSAKVVHSVNRVVQWVSLVFLGEWAFYGIFRCPFVVPFVSCQNCPVMTCPGRLATFFWGVWGLWLALAVFCGRAFCGWICPGGLTSRVLNKLNPVKYTMYPEVEKTYSYGKYAVLLACLWVYVVLGQPRLNVPIRIGEFWPSVSLTFQFASDLWALRTAMVVVLLLGTLAISTMWCRFACPMGGVLELIKHFSFFKVYKTSTCNNCNICQSVCYMRTRPEEDNCTNCGDCYGACPTKCIGIGRKAE